MASMNIRSGDTVEIIVGSVENRGKRGKVIVCDPKTNRIVVEGLNLVTKHRKPRSAQETGGKFEQPRPIDVSNVALVCPKCGQATRVAHVLGDDGKYLRACKKCGAVIDAKEEKKQTRASKSAEKKAAPKRTRKPKTEETAE